MTKEWTDREVQLDRMQYVKNTASSRLCYLAILLDVLYFISIYKSDVGSWYYQILTGASVVYNLLFMLAVFLASEGVKSYKSGYSWLMIALGALQIVRIFILPAAAHGAVVKVSGAETSVMGDGQFLRIVLYLALSAACLLLGALINLRKNRTLSAYMASLQGRQA